MYLSFFSLYHFSFRPKFVGQEDQKHNRADNSHGDKRHKHNKPGKGKQPLLAKGVQSQGNDTHDQKME